MEVKQLRLFRGRPPKPKYRQIGFWDECMNEWRQEQEELRRDEEAKKLQLVLIRYESEE